MDSRKYLVVEAYAEVASYRIPEYHNFHKTLPLPPPTALIGMAGAALGLEAWLAQRWFDDNGLEIGVYGTYEGLYTDLWKIASTKKETESSIVKREYLFRNNYVFVFGGSESLTGQLAEAFANNHYALTAGNSDSLMKIMASAVYGDADIRQVNAVEHCVLMGDFRSSLSISLERLQPNKAYQYKTMLSPVTYNLPYAFDYAEDGTRTIRQRKQVTFVGTRAELSDGIVLKAIAHKDVLIPIEAY